MARGDSTGPGSTAGSGAAGTGGPAGSAGDSPTTSGRAAGGGPTGQGGAAGGERTGQAGKVTAPGTRLGWIALAVAGVLTAWQVVYSLTAPTTPNPETYSSVSLLLTLVLSVGAIVLGIVALGQRAVPRWPATAATAIGVFAFIVCVATWIGTLMG